MNWRLAALLLLASIIGGCSREHSHDHAEESAHEHSAESGGHTDAAAHAHEGEPEGAHATIPAEVAARAGLESAAAGPVTLAETITLYGSIRPDATRVREVRARFPGIVRTATRQVGDFVREGDTLATVESNESLRTYPVVAPMSGVITQRHAHSGEQTGDQPLFEIADFSRVWAELKVFPRDRARLRTGQRVRVTAEGMVADGTISYIAPVGESGTQSVITRVELQNTSRGWAPGQFVEGHVTIAATPVPLGVPLSAVQTLREVSVVFEQSGEEYAPRAVRLGRRDAEHVEVLEGIEPGTRLVVRNSYLIKAEIEKAGASHDH